MTNETPKEISSEFRHALYTVWNYIGMEFEEGIPNLNAVEVCLDCDRLVMLAESEEAQTEARQLYATMGHSEALVFIATQVSLT